VLDYHDKEYILAKDFDDVMNELLASNTVIGYKNEEINGLFNELNRVENRLHAIELLVEEWLPQAKLNDKFREMFYYILGKESPDNFSRGNIKDVEQLWLDQTVGERDE